MSAKGRGATRREQDQYMTPDYTVMSLFKNTSVNMWFDASVIDPCCGDGEILRRLDSLMVCGKLYGNDIDPKMCEMALNNFANAEITNIDFISGEKQNNCKESTNVLTHLSDSINNNYDIAITNPPYDCWMQVVERMREISKFTWALLRINVFGSQSRNEFWNGPKNMPSDLIILSKRPRFRKPAGNYWLPDNYCCVGKGTDATEYAWFGWDNTRAINLETRIKVVK